MQDIPRRDFLGGAAGLMAALATGGCAPMADPSTKPSVQSMPKFAYVGSYTTKERNGQGEGINVYQVDPGTGNWTAAGPLAYPRFNHTATSYAERSVA